MKPNYLGAHVGWKVITAWQRLRRCQRQGARQARSMLGSIMIRASQQGVGAGKWCRATDIVDSPGIRRDAFGSALLGRNTGGH
jgi:hypothetical protein